MTIYRGLNVEKALIDIDDSLVSLINIGLDKDDLNLIYGLTGDQVSLTTSDLHNVSGLVDDQERILSGQNRASSEITRDLTNVGDIRVSLRANFNINSTLHGGAIKYNYIDFTDAAWGSKSADISTSRVSSWSPVGPDASPDDYIIYGGDAQVNGEYLAASQLTTSEAPVAKQFRAEVATHVLKMKVNGVEEKFLVMKGIPLLFDCSFKSATLTANAIGVQDGGSGTVPMVWKIINVDKPGGPYVRELTPGSSAPVFSFVDNTFTKSRRVEFYYNPANITTMNMRSLSMEEWTNVSLPALTELNISDNVVSFIPNFLTLAPALQVLDISKNPLYLADKFLSTADSTSDAQLNSLPSTIRSVKANGCFQDSGVIDLRTKTNLKTLQLSSQFGGSVFRKFTSNGHSPKVVNPMTRFIVDLSSVLNCVIGNGRIAIDNHGLQTGNFVKYDAHVSSSNTLGTGSGSNAATDLVVGTWSDGSPDTGTVYEVGTVTDDYFLLREAIGSGSDISSFSAQPTGDIHSFTKCDQNGNTEYGDSVGIVNYNIYNQSYQELDTGVINSNALTTINTQSTPINRNSDFPHFDSTNATTIGKSNQDRKIGTFRSSQITSFNTSFNSTDIINFSGKSALGSISISNHTVDEKYGLSEKTLFAKFDNLDIITKLSLNIVKNIAGDIKADGYAQNKPNLTSLQLTSLSGPSDDHNTINGSLADNFLSGTNLIKTFNVAYGSHVGRTTNDFLGVSGQINHTGKVFENKDVLESINVAKLTNSALRFINDDDPSNVIELNLKQCNKLKKVQIREMQMYGSMLDLTGVDTVTHYFINSGKQKVNIRAVKPGVIYKIVTNPLGGDLDTQTWKDIGWVQGNGGTGQDDADVVPWGTTTAHGADPQVGDYFKATAITDSNIRAGKRYIVLETGSGTDWNSVGASTGIVGTVFNASQNYVSASGSGKVMQIVGSAGVAQSIGLSSQVPALDMRKLRYLYAYDNSFIGQFPVLTVPRLSSIQFQNNQLSGTIPDMRSTVNSSNKSIRHMRFAGNNITGYESGTLSTLTYLRTLDLNNNQLDASISQELIFDLFENFIARKRPNCEIKLRNQGGTNPLTELAIQFDGTAGLNENSSYNKLLAMREGGWKILLD